MTHELRRKIAELKGYYDIKERWNNFQLSGLIRGHEDWKYMSIRDWPESIADAWELVEEIRAGGNEISLISDKAGDNSDLFTFVILYFRGDGKGTGWSQQINSSHETAPLAICAAYIAWREAHD